jgi:YD repeat-containing protein
MTDVETLLRNGLHDQLDGLQPSTLTASGALRAGHRARRRRTALVSATAALAVLAGVATGVTLLRNDTSSNDSVVAASALADRTATYAEQFRDGDFAGIRADMTPEVRSQLSEKQLRDTWQLAMDDLGPLVRITPPVLESGNPATYLTPLHFRSGDANMRVTYDSSGAVIGITLLSAQVEPLDTVPAALASESRQIVADLVAGRYDAVRSRFDATMTRKFSAAALSSAWRQVAVDMHGGFVSTGGLTATRISGNTVVDVFCTMHKGELKVRIAFDQQGLISGMFLLEA